MCAGPGRGVLRVCARGSLLLLSLPTALLAAPTQQDVFKSIQDNVNESADLSKLLPFLLAGGGLVLLLAIASQWRNREVRPKALNSPGKLVKEVMKTVPLRKAEWRQLKVLADDAPVETPLTSPLTLLLCPSVLAKSIRARQARHAKVDRKIVSAVARKAGVTREMLAGPGSRGMRE